MDGESEHSAGRDQPSGDETGQSFRSPETAASSSSNSPSRAQRWPWDLNSLTSHQ
jgi:hypothetical protein